MLLAIFETFFNQISAFSRSFFSFNFIFSSWCLHLHSRGAPKWISPHKPSALRQSFQSCGFLLTSQPAWGRTRWNYENFIINYSSGRDFHFIFHFLLPEKKFKKANHWQHSNKSKKLIKNVRKASKEFPLPQPARTKWK